MSITETNILQIPVSAAEFYQPRNFTHPRKGVLTEPNSQLYLLTAADYQWKKIPLQKVLNPMEAN